LDALIIGNFDDSLSDGDIWTVSGYVGYANQWAFFEELWGAALAKHSVPYFHMKEMNDPNGPFAKWLPHEQHQPEVIAFFTDLVEVIQSAGLRMISSGVWIADLLRFNAENSLSLEAYPLAAYACMGQVVQQYGTVPATLIFDRAEKVDDKLKKARVYAESDPRGGFCSQITTEPLPKSVTAREIPAMQAADFIAWEIRKALFRMKEWQSASDRPMVDREAQWNHYLEFTRKATGKDPILRKSLENLIVKKPTHNVVWDWHQIDEVSKFRKGIWTLDAVA
jgi:hypothetical protein